MKKIFVYLILVVISTQFLKAQVQFEKGYYIDNQSDTVYCLVKNKGWTDTPTSFTIKNIENNEKRNLSIDELKLIRISDEVKFVKVAVKEDTSDNNFEKIAPDKDVVYADNYRLLKVLVESKYSLYLHEDGNRKKFFFSGPDGEIRQLIDKRYYVNENDIGTSQEYIKQLLRINECESTELNNYIINTKLTEENLVYYFEQINSCSDSEVIKFEAEEDENKSKIKYSLKLGLNAARSEYQLASWNSDRKVEFPTDFTYAVGIELEIPIKANKFKWSIVFEPTFKHLTSSTSMMDQGIQRTYEFQVYSLDIPLGVRYKIYLSDDLLMFLNLKPQFTLNLGNSYVDLDFGQNREAVTMFNLNTGFGFKWKNLILEYRRDPQNILNQQAFEELVNYNNAFIIGYTFL